MNDKTEKDNQQTGFSTAQRTAGCSQAIEETDTETDKAPTAPVLPIAWAAG
jgi:hypothetical protein